MSEQICCFSEGHNYIKDVISFFATADSSKERMVFLFDEKLTTPDRILSVIEINAVEFIPSSVWYLHCEGRFSEEKTIDNWIKLAKQTRASGYTGLRAVAEMSWCLRSGMSDMAGYVYRVVRLMPNYIATMRIFDVNIIPPHIISDAAAVHPLKRNFKVFNKKLKGFVNDMPRHT